MPLDDTNDDAPQTPSPQTTWTTLLLATNYKAQCQIVCDVHNFPIELLSCGWGSSTNTSSNISDLYNAKSRPATSGLLRKETWIVIISPSIVSFGLISLSTSTTAQSLLALGASGERTDISSEETMQRDISINNTLERMPLQYEEEYNEKSGLSFDSMPSTALLDPLSSGNDIWVTILTLAYQLYHSYRIDRAIEEDSIVEDEFLDSSDNIETLILSIVSILRDDDNDPSNLIDERYETIFNSH
ncbi:hypothetical protein IFR04_009553 [Cadophora malorum]|uniref:Uncharacterized protein n=1 Tax=Cadophora malorum TaxID=108018 RepID=A0A8H7TEH3_9HELO|nr:hypothetical protein IFR04_009553 [Cadophora malorum]